jgi:hypothetical protein
VIVEPKETYSDAATGRQVTRLADPRYPTQHLYFTSPSVTADDRWLVVMSHRDGAVNLFALDRRENRMRQLTNNAHGVRLAYCYPYGNPRGLAKSTPCLDPQRNRVYALLDDQIHRIDLDTGESNVLWTIPANSVPSFTHISPDGRWLCVPLTNAQAFVDPARTQGEQMQRVAEHIDRGGVRTRLYLIDTQTGNSRVWMEVPFWVTHVHFDPDGSGAAIFNSEGLWHRQAKIPRIWITDTAGNYRPLFEQSAGEICGHENFAADGSIVYHGARASRQVSGDLKTFPDAGATHYLARRDRSGKLLAQHITDPIPIHHATPDRSGGYIVDSLDGMIYQVSEAGESKLAFTGLCRHDTQDLDEQDNHVHATLSPGGGVVVFTAMREGRRCVYELEFP